VYSNAFGTVLILVLSILINSDVLGRAIFNFPLPGVPEIAALAIVAIVFLQVAYCTRGGHLTRSDAFLSKLHQFYPRCAVALDAIHYFLGAIVFAIIAYSATSLAWKAWGGHEYEGALGVFTIPVWPVKAIVSIGSLVVVLQMLRMVWDRYRIIRDGHSALSKTFIDESVQ